MSSVVRVWSRGVIAIASCVPLLVAACSAFGEGASDETPTPPDSPLGADGGSDDGATNDGGTDGPTDATVDTKPPVVKPTCGDPNHLFCASFDGQSLLDNGQWPWTATTPGKQNELQLDTTNFVSGPSSLLVSMSSGSLAAYLGYELTETKLRVTVQLRTTPPTLTDNVTGAADVLLLKYRPQNSQVASAYVGLQVTPLATIALKWGDEASNTTVPATQNLAASWDTFHEVHLDLDLGSGTAQPSLDSNGPIGLYAIPRAADNKASLMVGLPKSTTSATFSANIDELVVDKR